MKFDLDTLVRRTLKTVAGYRYHWQHQCQADKALRAIESRLGPLRKAEGALADEYAVDVLGHLRYAPWLRVYAALAGQFKVGWIPDNYYGSVVVPTVKGRYGKVSDLKSLTKTIFRSDIIPDLAYYVNGLFYTTEKLAIHEAGLSSYLFGKHEQVVFKLDSSSQGRGIYFFNSLNFDVEHVKQLGNGVFQSYVKQHHVFNDFTPRSVATLRLTSVVDNYGIISVRSAFLRLSTGNDTHVQPNSEICVAIDPSSGEFSDAGYLPDWTAVHKHPYSGKCFAGVRIPAFRDCLSEVVALHGSIPFVRCIGWDVTVDELQRVRVLEWNAGHNDIKFSEAIQGPCFADLGWDRLSRENK
jgi:hypothetical protein